LEEGDFGFESDSLAESYAPEQNLRDQADVEEHGV